MIKKILAGALAVVLAFGLVACGNSKDDETTKKASSESSTEEGTKRYAATDEEIEVEYGVIKIADIKDVVVYSGTVNATKSDYKNAVSSILSSYTKTKTVKKGEVKDDSTVVVDYKGKIEVDGKKVAFEGGSAEDTTINIATDAGNYIDGFVSCLVGHKVGDKFTEKLKFPDDYEGTTTIDEKEVKLAGQTVWFTYTVKSLQVSKTPKLTDKFVEKNLKSQYDGVTTIAELKDYIYKQTRMNNIMSDVWQDYIDSAEIVSYNEDKKEEYIKTTKETQVSQIESQYQCTLSDYLEAASMSEEDFNKNIEDSAVSSIKQKMVIFALAKKQGISVSDDEYKVEAATLAESMSSSVKDLEKQYGKDEVEFAVLAQRVYDYFVDNITVKKGKKPEETTAAEETTKKAEKKEENK